MDAHALHQGDGTLRSRGGIAPFRLLNPTPVSKYGCLENFESNFRCFYNEIAPRTALWRCINNKIVLNIPLKGILSFNILALEKDSAYDLQHCGQVQPWKRGVASAIVRVPKFERSGRSLSECARRCRYFQVLREGESGLVVKATKPIAIRCARNDNHRLAIESECAFSQNFLILALRETRASGTRMGACRLASHEVSFMT